MTGSGNDFVLLDGRVDQPGGLAGRTVSSQLCDRRNGVGADGLVMLTPESPGVGPDGLLELRRLPRGHVRQRRALQRPARGLPRAGRARRAVPADRRRRGPAPGADGQGDQAEIRLPDFELARPTASASAARAGRRRALDGVRHRGRAAPGHPGGRHRGGRRPGPGPQPPLRPPAGRRRAPTSTSWRAPAEPATPWLIRTYERGVEGETLACGTGTVAAGVALAARGEAALPVRFRSRGGRGAPGAGGPGRAPGVRRLARWPGQAGVSGGVGGLTAAPRAPSRHFLDPQSLTTPGKDQSTVLHSYPQTNLT